MKKEHRYVAYLGLGSNIGERETQLLEAIRRLHRHPSVRVTAVSPMYETDPVGYTDQPAFLNIACRAETDLSAEELLNAALAIEKELGRERVLRWGPRTIDIDVLLYNDATIESTALTVPHPRLMERAFVLVPLLDVIQEKERDWRPGFAKPPKVDATGVRRWTNTTWPEESEPSAN
ncbi:2-amino-4-hydroxy-6-hydroxymethyldihydropteridine diphosphokinase [Paenibacillus sp. TRM 82003]|nr:2-amino-4-hydroxy-6-hydroxymethyldihydropteridine diphosphokinase [Paenibacillus sp. TRM 82003]